MQVFKHQTYHNENCQSPNLQFFDSRGMGKKL